MKMKNKRCGNCGSFDVKKSAYFGPLPWKDYPQVYLVKPFETNQCQVCNETMGPAGEGEKMDQAIEDSIRTQVNLFITKILEREHCKQVDLAERIGVTPEYLSALKSGARIPAFQTFNFLKVLAVNEQAFKLASPSAKLIA
jgi:DNA-binding transcriptional regulator YiaG